MIVMGSNTTEAHPIVSNRMIKAVRDKLQLTVIDVRQTQILKGKIGEAMVISMKQTFIFKMMVY